MQYCFYILFINNFYVFSCLNNNYEFLISLNYIFFVSIYFVYCHHDLIVLGLKSMQDVQHEAVLVLIRRKLHHQEQQEPKKRQQHLDQNLNEVHTV